MAKPGILFPIPPFFYRVWLLLPGLLQTNGQRWKMVRAWKILKSYANRNHFYPARDTTEIAKLFPVPQVTAVDSAVHLHKLQSTL